MNSVGVEVVREVVHPRRNGWSCPWHPFQLIAWFFIVLFTVTYYGFLVFYIPGLWRILAYVIPGLVLLVHVSASIVTTSINPAEPEVTRKAGHQARRTFDRSKHRHVIENHHCNICNVNVSANAKHCRLCDKCIQDFDHHCKWLNNCIGGRNYRWFLATLFSSLIGAVLLFLYTLALFILYFADRDHLRYDCNDIGNITACDSTIRLFGKSVPDPVFPTLVAILCFLAVIAVLLIGHLSSFHIYLLAKGLSTYDYIMLQREGEARAGSRRGDSSYHGRCGFLRRKLNRVTPGDDEQGPGDSGSVGSNNSAGMANFGRTPPPSDTSTDSRDDNRMGEEKLGLGGGCTEVDVVNTPSVLKESVPNEGVQDTPIVVPNGSETVIVMEEAQRETNGSLKAIEQGPGETCRDDDIHDCAAMVAANTENDNGEHNHEEEDIHCNTLAAMVSSNLVDNEGQQPTKNQVEMNVLSETVVVHLAVDKPTQSLVERHNELKAEAQQAMNVEFSFSPLSIPKQSSVTSSLMPETSWQSLVSYSSLAEDNPAICPLHPTLSPEEPLQEVPLNTLAKTQVLDESDGVRSPSPLTKKVSFMTSDTPGRPLPPAPLPPIGSSDANKQQYKNRVLLTASKEEPPWYTYRGMKNRPLPPLTYEEILGSYESLFSTSSTNSLPLPDPRYRYRRGLLPRLGSSDFTLDSAGKKKSRGRRKKRTTDDNEVFHHSCGYMPSESPTLTQPEDCSSPPPSF